MLSRMFHVKRHPPLPLQALRCYLGPSVCAFGPLYALSAHCLRSRGVKRVRLRRVRRAHRSPLTARRNNATPRHQPRCQPVPRPGSRRRHTDPEPSPTTGDDTPYDRSASWWFHVKRHWRLRPASYRVRGLPHALFRSPPSTTRRRLKTRRGVRENLVTALLSPSHSTRVSMPGSPHRRADLSPETGFARAK